MFFERATRFELVYIAWKAIVLPLNYARVTFAIIPLNKSMGRLNKKIAVIKQLFLWME